MSFKDKLKIIIYFFLNGGKHEFRTAHMDCLLYFYRPKYRTIFAATKYRHAALRVWIRSWRLIRLFKAPNTRTKKKKKKIVLA